MRVLTYPNPFKIKNNDILWDTITRYPHFCVSDTLAQGISVEYDRTSFSFLNTIDNLMKNLFEDVTHNPLISIQLYLDVSNIIRNELELPEDYKRAFKANIRDIVKAIEIFAFLDIDETKFLKEFISFEQKIFLEIFSKVKKSSFFEKIEDLKSTNKEDLKIAVYKSISKEVAFILNNYKEVKNAFPHFNSSCTPQHCLLVLEVIKKELIARTNLAPNPFDNNIENEIYDLKKVEHFIKILSNNDLPLDKLIFHGVHKITPEMQFLFKILEETLQIEVILLINYAKNLPNIYRTWKSVYSFVDEDFYFMDNLNISDLSEDGQIIYDIIECNELSEITPRAEGVEYANLTSFINNDVRTTYIKAEKKDSNNPLSKMETQYYAVSGAKSNEILKTYFPDQFNEKPFLSYPIGQFILGIYEMWDFENSRMKVNFKNLSECVLSNVYKSENNTNLLDVIRKTELYFSDIERIEDIYNRLDNLKISVDLLLNNNNYFAFKKLSFFEITFTEIDELKKFINYVEEISLKLFDKKSDNINYTEHFKELIEIVATPNIENKTLSGVEEHLVKLLYEKLQIHKGNNVYGDFKDIKDALAFFLSKTAEEEHSNWIVRGFEQIDGAVLLHKTTKAKKYNFALVSNSNITLKNENILPFPLTLDMFYNYEDELSRVSTFAKGLAEHKNFLEFSLIYGIMFSKVNIELSYVLEENDEEQLPYYLLNIIGVDFKKYEAKKNNLFPMRENKCNDNFHFENISKIQKDMFSICPYKFLQNYVLKSSINYTSSFHIKYFVSTFLYLQLLRKGRMNDNEEREFIRNEIKILKKVFPFWNTSVFIDLETEAIKLYKDHLNANNEIKIDEAYFDRKQNFLIAGWKENDVKVMDFIKSDIDDKINSYLESDRTYPALEELPHHKICAYCNYRDVCLRDYYEANSMR